MQLTGECSLEHILPSGTVFLLLVGFHHILPPDEHAGSPPVTWPIVLAQQPKLTLALVTVNDPSGSKLAFNLASYISDCTCILIMQ